MENKTKTNEQLFSQYYRILENSHAEKSRYEAKRLLEKFRAFLGQYPPSTELATQFLASFKDRKLNTRARYTFTISAFFRWYSGEKLPFKAKVPKILPQYVPDEDIERLIARIKAKKSHKKSLDRDVLLIETARMTGLRRGELANLKVGDVHLHGDDPVVIVRGGKGAKDRAVPLNPYIVGKLAAYVGDKSREESLFRLTDKSISMKIGQWARKAGVPHLHTHSLRHHVGTTLFQRQANPRSIQAVLGHESLEVTMRYASVTGQDTKETMQLLTPAPERVDKPGRATGSVDGIPDRGEGQSFESAMPAKPAVASGAVWGTPHESKMRELTQNLVGEIALPELRYRFVVPPETGDQEIEVRFSTDEGVRDHLFAGLLSHLESGGFADVLSDMEVWKSKAVSYLADCRYLVRQVVSNIEKNRGVIIPRDDKGVEFGFTFDFARFVCCGACWSLSGRDGLPYKIEPHPFYDGRWVLRYGGYGIYIADSERELEKYLALHRRLIAKYAGGQMVSDLLTRDSELYQLGLRIIQRLSVFRDTEPLPGGCQLCQISNGLP